MKRSKKGRSAERSAKRAKSKGFGKRDTEELSTKGRISARTGKPYTGKEAAAAATDDDLMKIALADLKRSGLDRSDFKKLRLEVMDRDDTDDFVGEPRASYRIPYFDLRGRETAYSRVRFLETRKKKFTSGKNKDGSFRYSQPRNSSPHVYFPPYFNWKKLAADVETKILITEGEKKAAAACKMGIPCIALGGVHAFQSKKHMFGLLPELEEFEWNGRQIEVCYDADVMMKSEVRQALSSLAMTLTQRYALASLEFVFLDAETVGPKTGLDDFLLEHGSDGFEKLPRQEFQAAAKIALLNTKVCYVKSKLQFFDIETGKYFKNLNHVKEAYLTEGEEMVDGKRSMSIVELWAKSASRRTVNEILYKPGEAESKHDALNLWKPTPVQPKKGTPKKWLELVHYIMREPEYAEWFMKWLAFPIQHPGTKMFQAPFVYGKKQGIGKTFTVDPVMEFLYGDSNFHRLGNNDVTSIYNEYIGCKQFIVTNEIYLPDYSDRRAAMGTLKDMVTREKVTVNEKFQPRVTFTDHCNYYFTSNHADALILEQDDRRFFVIEAPNEKWDQEVYKDLDTWLREGDGPAVILHYLGNLDLGDMESKGDALMTPWKRQLIALSKDALGEFGDRVVEDTKSLFMVNGNMPDLQLFKAADMLRIFEHMYPKYRFNVTIKRMGGILDDPRIEKRSVRMAKDEPLQTLYALMDRDVWRKSSNKEWAEHYTSNAKMYGGKSRH